MGIKKLLFVTDFEELWFDALQSLMNLRDVGLNHVVFLHVIDRDKVAMQRGVGYAKGEAVRLKEMANVRFIDWAESLFEQGMEVGAHITVGNFVPKIVAISKDEDVDLIVSGYHKSSKLKELYAGTDIMEILRRSEKPVLVYKYQLETGMINDKPFERPILVMDWFSNNDRAIKFLLGFKGIIQKVQVINISGEKSLEGESAMDVQKARKENRAKLDKVCEVFESEGIEAEQHFYVGDFITQVEKAAQERQGTMIVTSVAEKGPLKERWLGSLPNELAEKSGFPTLLFPAVK